MNTSPESSGMIEQSAESTDRDDFVLRCYRNFFSCNPPFYKKSIPGLIGPSN